ncbi:MAG: 5-oxoprolinase subunit PxpB, partial [Pyrinomonadaceae bacterium]
AAESLNQLQPNSERAVEIPVHFDNGSALDLEFVAECSGMDAKSVIEIFVATTYRVFMLGFLPGFSYMGEVDNLIATPRKETPRLKIPKGSVGIAGKQAGIYSLESPGGWQILGKTDVELFTPKNDPLTFLQAGDAVRFVAA